MGGTGITLKPTTTASGGAISGPRQCPKSTCLAAQPACTEKPNAGFPAATTAASAALWPSGQQPTNAQCWPRDYSGFPISCTPQKVTILEDTATGWAGKCQGLKKQVLAPGQTCAEACLANILCSVWQIVNFTTVPECWQGSFGYNCYEYRHGFFPTSSQRVMHGTYRVLMDLTGRQVMGLSKMFSANNMFNSWQIAAKHCKLFCIANLGCQYWLYSRLSGCWAEDPEKSRVSYPLINDPDVSLTGTDAANAVVAGEMIQHYCGDDTGSCGVKKAPSPPPTFPPTVPHVAMKAKTAPKSTGCSWIFCLPTWAVVLLSIGILLVCGALTGAAVMYFKKLRQRRNKSGRGYSIGSGSEDFDGDYDDDYETEGNDYEMQSMSNYDADNNYGRGY